jgi:hypothetical protein
MKKNSKLFILFALLVVAAMALTACGGEAGPAGPQGEQGPEGPQGPAGEPGADAMFSIEDVTCVDCHNDSAALAGVAKQWEESVHATGEAAAYAGGRSGCSDCHSSAGFSAMVASGQNPDEGEFADAHPVGPDCRACHQVHTTYTGADFALETSDPVALYAFEGATYDGGSGNLCATCHQPRRAMALEEDGTVNVSSTHWGPHHGPQAAVLLGVSGELVEGTPSSHYNLVEDGCVTCHMGEGANHTFEPQEAACETCHGEDFDYSEVTAEVAALIDELKALLVANGLWDEEADENMTGFFPADQAGALWNYILIVKEDKSMGVHNANYIRSLLEASIAVFGE